MNGAKRSAVFPRWIVTGGWVLATLAGLSCSRESVTALDVHLVVEGAGATMSQLQVQRIDLTSRTLPLAGEQTVFPAVDSGVALKTGDVLTFWFSEANARNTFELASMSDTICDCLAASAVFNR